MAPRVERRTLILDDQRDRSIGQGIFDGDRLFQADTAMFDHVGDQLFDDDAQPRLVTGAQAQIGRIAAGRGDGVAKRR